MAQLDREELLKIAALSALKLKDEEIAPLLIRIKEILDYTDELATLSTTVTETVPQNQNIMREDAATPYQETSFLLEEAPAKSEHYFVVPRIVEE